MTSRRHRLLALLTPLVLAAAAAAPAHGAAVQGPSCHIFERYGVQNVPIGGSGFLPGESVRVEYVAKSGKTNGAASTAADPAGNFAVNGFPAIYNRFDTQDQTFTLRATGMQSGIVAAFPYRQVRPLTLTPNRVSNARKKIRYTVRGLPTGKTIYAHFRYNGRTLGRVALGKAVGPCGIATRRIPGVPKVRRGRWNVQFDASRRYSKKTRPRVTTSLTVGNVFY